MKYFLKGGGRKNNNKDFAEADVKLTHLPPSTPPNCLFNMFHLFSCQLLISRQFTFRFGRKLNGLMKYWYFIFEMQNMYFNDLRNVSLL